MTKTGLTIVAFVGFFVVGFWGMVIRELLTDPIEDKNFLGGAILVLGVILALFHRSIGKQVYRQPLPFKSVSTDSSWKNFGETNTQMLYLVFGIITAIAGGIILLVLPGS